MQIAGQPDGLHGDGDLSDEVVQEPPIRCAEGVPVSPGGQREPSDVFPAVGQGEVQQVGVVFGSGAVFGGDDEHLVMAEFNGNVGQFERVGHGGDDGR